MFKGLNITWVVYILALYFYNSGGLRVFNHFLRLISFLFCYFLIFLRIFSLVIFLNFFLNFLKKQALVSYKIFLIKKKECSLTTVILYDSLNSDICIDFDWMLGSFFTFWVLMSYFWGWGRVGKLFGVYSCSCLTFILYVFVNSGIGFYLILWSFFTFRRPNGLFLRLG